MVETLGALLKTVPVIGPADVKKSHKTSPKVLHLLPVIHEDSSRVILSERWGEADATGTACSASDKT